MILYLRGRSCVIMRSISVSWLPLALSRRLSSVSISLVLRASSPALLTIPHLIHISMRSAGFIFVHFATKDDARRVLPAERTSLKNGCQKLAEVTLSRNRLTSQPIGDFRFLPSSSMSPQSLAATRARSRIHHHVLSVTLNSLLTRSALLL